MPGDAAAPLVTLRGVTRVFPPIAAGGQSDPRAWTARSRPSRGRVLRCGRSVGLRKIHAVRIDRRTAAGTDGTIAFEGQTDRGHRARWHRRGVPGGFRAFPGAPFVRTSHSACGNPVLSRAEQDARIERVLALMNLIEFAGHYPAQLSGGMRQRVCIARTLVMEPRLILLDEPFAALDQQTRLLMGEEVLRLWRATGATVFLITHALDEAAMLSDRIAVMSARPGRILDIVKTAWPRERDSRILEDARFGAVSAHLWRLLRERNHQGRRCALSWRLASIRALILLALVGVLELLCAAGSHRYAHHAAAAPDRHRSGATAGVRFIQPRHSADAVQRHDRNLDGDRRGRGRRVR